MTVKEHKTNEACRKPELHILNEYETAYLIDRKSGRKISEIADMYGDPAGAEISGDEKFCVVIGCGAFVYFIDVPLESYALLMDGGIWFEEILYLDNNMIRLRSEDNKFYEIDVYARKIMQKY